MLSASFHRIPENSILILYWYTWRLKSHATKNKFWQCCTYEHAHADFVVWTTKPSNWSNRGRNVLIWSQKNKTLRCWLLARAKRDSSSTPHSVHDVSVRPSAFHSRNHCLFFNFPSFLSQNHPIYPNRDRIMFHALWSLLEHSSIEIKSARHGGGGTRFPANSHASHWVTQNENFTSAIQNHSTIHIHNSPS